MTTTPRLPRRQGRHRLHRPPLDGSRRAVLGAGITLALTAATLVITQAGETTFLPAATSGPSTDASAELLGSTALESLQLIDDRCPADASICHYRLPAGVTQARADCQQTAAGTWEIPGDPGAYRAWWAGASPAQRQDWDTAFIDCQARHRPPGGIWNWAALPYVGSTR